VRHPDLRADPIGTAGSIYAALGLPFGDATRGAMEDFLRAREASPGGRHAHALETLGLEAGDVRERLDDYCESVSV